MEIDLIDLLVVIKFFYFKELLEFYVCEVIDGFFFIIEGYECVKNILKFNYGKISEIVRVYVDNINVLLIVYGLYLSKIY